MVKTWQEYRDIHENLSGPISTVIKHDLMQAEIDGLRARLTELEKRNQINQSARATVDNLLAQSGYAEDSSARNLLGCMNFDAAAGAPPESSALQEENAKLITALAECRDAFPVPPQYTTLAHWYVGAMADPLEVPGYVGACVAGASPVQPSDWETAMLDGLAAHCIDTPVGTPPRDILAKIIAAAIEIDRDPLVSDRVQPSQAEDLSVNELAELYKTLPESTPECVLNQVARRYIAAIIKKQTT